MTRLNSDTDELELTMSMLFSSIEHQEIKEKLVSFVQQIGEMSGFEKNHQSIISILESEL